MTDLELMVAGPDAQWSLLAMAFPGGAVLAGERRGQGTTQTFPEVDVEPATVQAWVDALSSAPAAVADGQGLPTLTLRRDGREVFARPCPVDATLTAWVAAACAADPEGAGPHVARALGLEVPA
ncbi:MAG: hypothetical protein RIT45_3750 [Pseudomonadota bacterium]|jgi:hypothetical protein